MNYIYLILFFNILSAFSFSTKPNICIDCKFFRKEFLSDNKFGKCLLFPLVEDNKYFLVDGIKNKDPTNYHFCSTARKIQDMCGDQGKFFEKK